MPFTENNIKSYSIPSGVMSWNGENIYTGDIPQKVVVALTSAEVLLCQKTFTTDHFSY